ncbi:hypothetical protein Nmel_009357 [Mimus melanotis]
MQGQPLMGEPWAGHAAAAGAASAAAAAALLPAIFLRSCPSCPQTPEDSHPCCPHCHIPPYQPHLSLLFILLQTMDAMTFLFMLLQSLIQYLQPVGDVLDEQTHLRMELRAKRLEQKRIWLEREVEQLTLMQSERIWGDLLWFSLQPWQVWAVAGLLVLLLGLYFFWRKRRDEAENSGEEDGEYNVLDSDLRWLIDEHIQWPVTSGRESFRIEMLFGVRRGDSDIFVSSQPEYAGTSSTLWPETYAVAEMKFFQHIARQAPPDSLHLRCLQLFTRNKRFPQEISLPLDIASSESPSLLHHLTQYPAAHSQAMTEYQDLQHRLASVLLNGH